VIETPGRYACLFPAGFLVLAVLLHRLRTFTGLCDPTGAARSGTLRSLSDAAWCGGVPGHRAVFVRLTLAQVVQSLELDELVLSLDEVHELSLLLE
jgi:hypothetical protein